MGLALAPEPEEQQGYGVCGGGEMEENKSLLEGVLVFFFFLSFFLFFKWIQDYRTLSPTEGIFHLLLSNWAFVVYMLNY
jgi:quinol-cytochrome oxidoreductase complex cytochrome b subunit